MHCYISIVQVVRELSGMILSRGPKLCNFIEWRDLKVVYKRYYIFSYTFPYWQLCSQMTHMLILVH